MLAKPAFPSSYLWDWILSRGRSCISAEVNYNPAFWYICHPDAFKQLSLIQEEESAWAMFLSIFPTSFIPIIICCNQIHEQTMKFACIHQEARYKAEAMSEGLLPAQGVLQHSGVPMCCSHLLPHQRIPRLHCLLLHCSGLSCTAAAVVKQHLAPDCSPCQARGQGERFNLSCGSL